MSRIEPITYEQCLEIIPQIQEEKDHWKEKYRALRAKVGEQFVDIIPEVWNEEARLEEEREKTVSQLQELRQEISEKETPVMKAVSEKERIEAELRKVDDELEVCRGDLKLLGELQEEEEIVEANERKLVECLDKLELQNEDSLQNEGKIDEDSDGREDDKIQHGNVEDLESNLEKLYNEMEILLAEEENIKAQCLESKEKDIDNLVNQKTDVANEIKNIESVISELEQGFTARKDSKQSSFSSSRGARSQNAGVNNELEKVQQEINTLQAALDTPSVSSGQEVSNLLALMKEKSKLEDELADTEKSLGQLGKRDYDALVKERQTQEKVARKLLELSREKEVGRRRIEGSAGTGQEKESELLKSFNAELKSKQVSETPSKKRRGFRRKKSSFETKVQDAGKVSF